MDSLHIIKEKFKSDKFATEMGIILDDLSPGNVKMHMVLDEKKCNFYQRPHGAAIYALADAAFSVIGNNANNISVALDCSITYHSSPDVDTVLYVEGREIASSRKIGTYLFSLFTLNGEQKVPVATMKSVLYKTGKQIQPE